MNRKLQNNWPIMCKIQILKEFIYSVSCKGSYLKDRIETKQEIKNTHREHYRSLLR